METKIINGKKFYLCTEDLLIDYLKVKRDNEIKDQIISEYKQLSDLKDTLNPQIDKILKDQKSLELKMNIFRVTTEVLGVSCVALTGTIIIYSIINYLK